MIIVPGTPPQNDATPPTEKGPPVARIEAARRMFKAADLAVEDDSDPICWTIRAGAAPPPAVYRFWPATTMFLCPDGRHGYGVLALIETIRASSV